MAEKRQWQHRIAITDQAGRRRVSELFPAELFPGGQGLEGRFRVRIDRTWHRPGGIKYAFLPLEEALAVVGWGAGRESPRPDLPRGSWVRVPTGWAGCGEGERLHEATVTFTEPFSGPDGRWRVFVVGRRGPVLVDDLERKE
jgi:hypothetical protein